MLLIGDALARLKELSDGSAHCCVTSPPYWGLRDYGHEGQIGLEASPGEFVERLVGVFREVRRVLRDDGTLWLNLGDSYGHGTSAGRQQSKNPGVGANRPEAQNSVGRNGLAAKQLAGIPWRVAFALQADGWYLRQDIIWHKPNPMPESVTDRCTKAHEYLFLLSKSDRYFYDQAAILERASYEDELRWAGETAGLHSGEAHNGTGESTRRFRKAGNKERRKPADIGIPISGTSGGGIPWEGVTRNKRSVWSVVTQPFDGAHFATFPPKLIEPCILAGSPPGGVVLDPFFGAGTTGVVAVGAGRDFIGIELNPEYAAMAERRIKNTQPGLVFAGGVE